MVLQARGPLGDVSAMKPSFSYPPLYALITLLLASLACNTLLPPRPKVEWDTDPNALIVSATISGGMVPQSVAINYIPDAQVWGDGRIVWVEYLGDGQRRVLEATLTPDQLRAFLQRAVGDGFFGWEASYADYNVYDAATQCLSLALASNSKSVCEYVSGAPRAFHTLYGEVASGLGLTGSDYRPERGYLTAQALNYEGQPTPEVLLHWPANSMGLSLSDAAGGAWVEGEALELAWRMVNTNLWGGLVQEGETYYELTLQVPGVSQILPPEP